MGLSASLLGSGIALSSAAAWALCSILFHRIGEESSPAGMNLAKCAIGACSLGITLLCIGTQPMDAKTFLLLGSSGLLGIALGDTFFFKALSLLGPRLILLLETLGPLVTVLLAVIFLHERPSFLIWIGALLVLGGITVVVWEKMPREKIILRVSGIICALLFVLCNSVAIILAKVAIASLPALQATFIRLAWAMAGLCLWGALTRQLAQWTAPFKNLPLFRNILFSSLLADFGGFWLSLLALKYIDVSVATILNATTPLFILPLAFLMLNEKISLRAILGATSAVAGVGLVLFLQR